MDKRKVKSHPIFGEPKEVQEIPIGDVVLCDLCNKDWTNDPTPGGFVFGSKGVCPDCAEEFMEGVKKYGEEEYIRAVCPPDQSHADFIRDFRGPDAKITITSF